jgi:nitrite reductase/ring-hydroxylating ferredoxin subunit
MKRIHSMPEAPNSATSDERGRGVFHAIGQIMRWQTLFPYHWDADTFVTRREMLRLTVSTSGALFAVTAAIVGLGYARPLRGRRTTKAILRASALPPGSVHYFQYPGPEDQAILLHLREGQFVAYSGRCTHLSCAVYYDSARETLICPCHDGAFDPRTGEPVAGPPQRPLPTIQLQQQGGTLYAIEESPA